MSDQPDWEKLRENFSDVLASDREEDTQSFLAKHQQLLLAAFGDIWTVNECIPKFRFGTEFISDFVIITGQSCRYEVTLIELEPPTAIPFTKQGKYARRLNDAMGQINDWLAWIHNNDSYFRSRISAAMQNEYGSKQISNPIVQSDLFVSCKIIIGRRSNMSREDDIRRTTLFRQAHRQLEIVPYDRLLDRAVPIDDKAARRFGLPRNNDRLE